MKKVKNKSPTERTTYSIGEILVGFMEEVYDRSMERRIIKLMIKCKHRGITREIIESFWEEYESFGKKRYFKDEQEMYE
jgi:hypothetical protein